MSEQVRYNNDKAWYLESQERIMIRNSVPSNHSDESHEVLLKLVDLAPLASEEIIDPIQLATERQILTREFGVTDIKEIITQYRTLKDALAVSEERVAQAAQERVLLEREFGTTDPTVVATQIRDIKDRDIRLQSELDGLRRKEDRLLFEVGIADPLEIGARLRSSYDTIAELTSSLYQLQENQRILEDELGKTDGKEIAAMVRALNERLEMFQEVAAMLGSIEDDLKSFS